MQPVLRATDRSRTVSWCRNKAISVSNDPLEPTRAAAATVTMANIVPEYSAAPADFRRIGEVAKTAPAVARLLDFTRGLPLPLVRRASRHRREIGARPCASLPAGSPRRKTTRRRDNTR
jgi:hypothetical protein